MVDQLVVATISVLLEKAVLVGADWIGLVLGFGFHKDVEAMQEHAKDIRAVLADAEAKQSRNPFVLRWRQKVEVAAVKADYVLDELLYESLRRKVKYRDKVCVFFSLSKHDLSFRLRMGYKVREINQMFKNFILEVPMIGLIRIEDSIRQVINIEDSIRQVEEVDTSRLTNSLPIPFVAGRVREVSEIMGMLLSASSEACVSVSVLSMFGMGGLGKTTLAKSIYNNPGIDSHFGRKIWVCVSNKFEAMELFRLILESLKGVKVEKPARDVIVRNIQEELAGKRFLLVLDDVWNEDPKLWDDFYTSLVGLNTASGSCCLVTTRSNRTAKLVSTFNPFALAKLADDECWNIIGRRATKDGEMPQQLNVHREQILKKCQGLPLAANAVGGLLSLQKREDWLSIVEDKILKVGDYVEGEITPLVKLSFDYLPSLSIKKCFAYCSIYPKDAEMNGNQLVELWMAEGFIQEGVERRNMMEGFIQEGVERRTMMEEVGHNYLTVLLQCSLLEKVYGDFYQMNVLVHDLAESVSKREQIDGEVRHLTLASAYNRYNASSTWVQILEGEISDGVLLRFKRLHVLNLSGRKTKNLPNVIGKSKHLRLLDVSNSKIEFLPESLCKLYNLQTLRLTGCSSLKYLPHGLNNLISLRHLYFDRENNKLKMPPNMGQLTGLQTLNFFNVGEEKGCEIKELGSMKNLKGTIEIRNLELVKGKEGARSANLFEKQKLVGLELCWGSTDCRDIDTCDDEHVLEGLEPHPKLEKLWLWNYMGVQFPQWFGKLTALTELGFINCKSLEDLPALGHLPYLEVLKIEGSEHVICIGDSFYSDGLREGEVFPSLKRMNLENLPNLSEWKELEAVNGHVFPKLESLHICDCFQLASVPTSFPSLEELIIEGNIQVSVVKDIMGKSASLLKRLVIRSMGGLNSFADVIENHLTCLEHIEISGCDNLIDIPSSTLKWCTSLKTLSVIRCPNLNS